MNWRVPYQAEFPALPQSGKFHVRECADLRKAMSDQCPEML